MPQDRRSTGREGFRYPLKSPVSELLGHAPSVSAARARVTSAADATRKRVRRSPTSCGRLTSSRARIFWAIRCPCSEKHVKRRTIRLYTPCRGSTRQVVCDRRSSSAERGFSRAGPAPSTPAAVLIQERSHRKKGPRLLVARSGPPAPYQRASRRGRPPPPPPRA